MTVSSQNRRARHLGNGVTDTFPYAFRVFAGADLEVTLTDTDGNETVQVLGVDYTVTGAGDANGGNVVMATPPANGEVLTIVRDMEFLQETAYPAQGGYQASVVEGNFDRLVMLLQQLLEVIDRTVKVPVSSDLSALELPLPAPDAYLRWNDTATALINATLQSAGNLVVSSFIETLLDDADAGAARVTLGQKASGSFFTRQHNFGASVAPGVGDDTGDGYAVGSWWFDTANGNAYVCTDAALGAAVWRTVSADVGPAYKNRIVNGDMRIDQRNGGASVTVDADVTVYGPDMWRGTGQAADGKFTMQRSASSPPSGFTHFLRCTVATADASVGASQRYILWQPIEGLSMSDLGFGAAGARTITLSFWVRCSITGDFSGALRSNGGLRSFPFTITVDVANTWEFKTVVIPGDTTGTWVTDNSQWGHLSISLGAGTDFDSPAGAWAGGNYLGPAGGTALISSLGATFDLTGVQLEPGAGATDFERAGFGEMFRRCQRYLQRFDGANNYFAVGHAFSTSGAFVTHQFPVPMRVAPTFSYSALADILLHYQGSTTAVTSVGSGNISTRSAALSLGCAAVLTAGNAVQARVDGAADYVQFAAEL